MRDVAEERGHSNSWILAWDYRRSRDDPNAVFHHQAFAKEAKGKHGLMVSNGPCKLQKKGYNS